MILPNFHTGIFPLRWILLVMPTGEYLIEKTDAASVSLVHSQDDVWSSTLFYELAVQIVSLSSISIFILRSICMRYTRKTRTSAVTTTCCKCDCTPSSIVRNFCRSSGPGNDVCLCFLLGLCTNAVAFLLAITTSSKKPFTFARNENISTKLCFY